jgi:hypothetical protein
VRLNIGLLKAAVEERLRAAEAERAIRSGCLSARFDLGAIFLSCDEKLFTHSIHLHTEVSAGNIWNMSHDLQWAGVKREGDALCVSGMSPRFPYLQHWRLEPAPDNAIAFSIWLEALEPLDIQEYNVSLGLRHEYEHFETPYESGDFPPFDPEQKGWHHVNHNYAPGTYVRVSANEWPTVALESTEDSLPFRMTVINTGFEQHTRVLQAIRTPGQAESLHYEPGKHLLFSGCVRIITERTS